MCTPMHVSSLTTSDSLSLSLWLENALYFGDNWLCNMMMFIQKQVTQTAIWESSFIFLILIQGKCIILFPANQKCGVLITSLDLTYWEKSTANIPSSLEIGDNLEN